MISDLHRGVIGHEDVYLSSREKEIEKIKIYT